VRNIRSEDIHSAEICTDIPTSNDPEQYLEFISGSDRCNEVFWATRYALIREISPKGAATSQNNIYMSSWVIGHDAVLQSVFYLLFI